MLRAGRFALNIPLFGIKPAEFVQLRQCQGPLHRLAVPFEFLDYPLQRIQTRFELFHFRTEADPAIIFIPAMQTPVARIHILFRG